MKIETSAITKLQISDIPNLDAISVFLEDIAPGQGRITINHFSSSWIAAWGGMSGRTVSEFFCICNEDYLAGNLSNIEAEVDDLERFGQQARHEILAERRKRLIDAKEARSQFDSLADVDFEHPYNAHSAKALHAIFGDDWWCRVPKKPNPAYQHLCRVIRAVQEALRVHTGEPKHETV